MADNYQVKDAAAVTISIAAKEESAGVYSPRMTPRVAGADVSSVNPLPIGAQALTDIANRTPALGQAAMAASTPVVLASNQSPIPVTITSSGPSGVLTGPESAALTGMSTRTLAAGQAAMAVSYPVVIASNQSAVPVSLSGVATAAKQPAISLAGSPSVDVITVQGSPTGSPIPVSVVVSGSPAPLSSFCSENQGSGGAFAIKASAGDLNGYAFSNSSTAAMFFRFYNSAATNTWNSVVFSIRLAPGASANLMFPKPLAFTSGIVLRMSQSATSGNTQVPANAAIDFVATVLFV